MSVEGVARNYAEALFALGEQTGKSVDYADLLHAVAGAIATSPRAQAVLLSPRVPKQRKAQLLADALPGQPAEFVRFLQAVVKRGRQALFSQMAEAYQALVDDKLGRVRAHVTLARQPDAAMQEAVRSSLAKALGKEVIASFSTDPELIGGAVVRVGTRVHDGSLKRRMAVLRRQLIAG